MIQQSNMSLTFGALEFLCPDKLEPYWFELIVDGTDMGDPEPIVRAVDSFLQDGAIEATESYGNREVSLTVGVGAHSSAGLAAGEAALVAETARRNTLVWTPPDVGDDLAGEACVFDVVNSSLAQSTDDLAELRLERIYTLTIKALPFARTSAPVTVTTPTPTVTTPNVFVFNNGSSTTGWSATGTPLTPTPPATDGSIVSTTSNNGSAATSKQAMTLLWSGSQSMTGTPFVRINGTLQTPYNTYLFPEVKLNGVLTPRSGSSGNMAYYAFAGTTLTSVEIAVKDHYLAPGQSMTLRVDDLARTDTSSPYVGLRQTGRVIEVKGSTRSQGSLSLANTAGTRLGTTLVYTYPGDVAAAPPALRAFRTQGPTETTDSGLVSGKSSDLGTSHVFEIPVSQVIPGGYVLMARMKAATASGAFNIQSATSSVMPGMSNSSLSDLATTNVSLETNFWFTKALATWVLPTRRMGRSGVIQIYLGPNPGVLFDEAWLFNVDAGRLSWAEASAGAFNASRMWLDAPTPDNPTSLLWLGNAADRSDAIVTGTAISQHEFTPPYTNVFVVNSDSVSTDLSYTYHPTFHTHVATT